MNNIKVFAEISPEKDKNVCSNCSYWFGWGVSTGMCVKKKHDTNQGYSCNDFELTELNPE